MKINFTFKNFEPSDHLKKYARKRFEKLAKFVDNKSENSELQVNLNVDKFRHKAEVLLSGDNVRLTAAEESEDMYSTIDMVLDKIEAQVKKTREKSKGKAKRRGKEKSVSMEFISYSEAEDGTKERTITSRDHYEPKPMSVDEAADQLDNLEYEFLVFLNAETERVNVIYRRKNNDFGLIDPGT